MSKWFIHPAYGIWCAEELYSNKTIWANDREELVSLFKDLGAVVEDSDQA